MRCCMLAQLVVATPGLAALAQSASCRAMYSASADARSCAPHAGQLMAACTLESNQACDCMCLGPVYSRNPWTFSFTAYLLHMVARRNRPEVALCAQALREGRLRGAALAADERLRRPGLGTLVLDEADLMLAMPGYADDLCALAPLVRVPVRISLFGSESKCIGAVTGRGRHTAMSGCTGDLRALSPLVRCFARCTESPVQGLFHACIKTGRPDAGHARGTTYGALAPLVCCVVLRCEPKM